MPCGQVTVKIDDHLEPIRFLASSRIRPIRHHVLGASVVVADQIECDKFGVVCRGRDEDCRVAVVVVVEKGGNWVRMFNQNDCA